MKKMTKLFTGMLMGTMMLGTTAFASTQSYFFSLYPGQLQSTENYSKADNEQRAYVNATNVNNYDKVWFKVKSSNNAIYTNSVWRNSSGKFTLNYQGYAPKGGAYHLNVQQDSKAPLSVRVAGQWTP